MTGPSAPAAPWQRDQLVAAFHGVGLDRGDSVIVHSSCRALGPVAGGADTLLDALLQVLGPHGNLMLPTFNYTHPLPKPCFDPDVTPGRTGILAELGRKRRGAVRSLHPTHSVAVIGPAATDLTRGHHRVRAFGIDSPIDRLARRRGKVLLLGVGHTSNSMLHVAEEYAGIPKVSRYQPPPRIPVRTPEGEMIAVTLDTSPSCSLGFGAMEEILCRRGAIRYGRLGSCLLQLLVGEDVIRHGQERLRARPDFLLCSREACASCQGTRAKLQHTSSIGKKGAVHV